MIHQKHINMYTNCMKCLLQLQLVGRYLKEIERFERQTHNSIHHPEQRQRQDYNRCFTGCLCFTRRGRHRLNDPVELPI